MWHNDVVRLFAKHRTSGTSLPSSVLDRLRYAQGLFFGMETEHSVFLGMLDQRLHHGAFSRADIAEIVANTQKQFTHLSVPQDGGALYCPSTFSHLSSYGASYYSYQFANIFSKATWQKYFSRDPLSRESGTRLVRSVLSKGSSQDPTAGIVDLLGSLPDPLEVDLPF